MGIVQRQCGAGFLLYETDPDEVLTPEDMDDEQRMMMTSIRDFAEREVIPVMDEIEKRNWQVIQPLFKKAADLGIFMAEVPEEYGGLGLSVLGIAGMNESRSYLGGMSSTIFAHQGIGTLPLINFGTREQIDRYLDRCMSGEIMTSFALTEPSSGSDAMNIKTAAVLNDRGTHYIVNGSKQFITNAGWANLFILFAKVDGVHFTAFLLDGDTPGITVGPNEKLLGLHGSSVCPLTLEHVEIPVENVLGEVGKGHKVALCTLNLGRLKMSANCTGSAKKVLECAATYAGERYQFGNPIAEFGLIRRKLSDMAARLYATESIAYRTAGLVYRAIEAMDEEDRHSIDAKLKALAEFSIECALAKVHGAEMYNALADEALQIHGGYGYSEEYPAAKMYRDSRITRIYEGTSEICRLTALKAILKRSAKGDLPIGEAIRGVEPRSAPDGSADRDTGLTGLRESVANLKRIFLYVMGETVNRFGHEQLLDNDNQQLLSDLADIAIEIYAVESTVLRVLKLRKHHEAEQTQLPEALARIYFERAATRVREKAVEILTTLHEGDALRERLATIAGWQPLPVKRVELDEYIARTIVENKGVLPEYRN
ncbi:MAG: acyl-CoA dehydrogenase family protein [Candidatus Hydrogenedentes bacterium]|nr:acyl-CoA dehydrogenase family protein [Candidatus Hydrogenedentota bacterium]